jgi:hypothetical protein
MGGGHQYLFHTGYADMALLAWWAPRRSRFQPFQNLEN